MKVSNIIGERFKDKPSYCVSDNHAILVKGGYIKQVSNGVYSLNPIMNKIVSNIETIVKEELERIGAQEVMLSGLTPLELLKTSDRNVDSVAKFTDSDNIEMVPLHTVHELAIQLVRDSAKSYVNYPFTLYQHSKEFAKGKKPSGGLVNLKESYTNSVYSFHATKEDQDATFEKISKIYNNILLRCGLEEVVEANSSYDNSEHRVVVFNEIGDTNYVACEHCDYVSSFDTALSIVENSEESALQDLTLVHTPGVTTIASLAEFLSVDVKTLCKSVAYQKYSDGSLVVGFIRGDLDINQSKLEHLVGDNLYPAELHEDSILSGGFIGPYNIPKEVDVYFDKSLMGIESLAIGANEFDKHYTGFNVERDYGEVEYKDLADVMEGDQCPLCGAPSLHIKKAVELGELVKTNDTLTKAMSMQFLDDDGANKSPFMGAYRLDLLKLVALICEESHDDYGPIWPRSVAPWMVQICCLRSDDQECKSYADDLYAKLKDRGIEVLYDDRKVRPGSMFSDADLFGVPLRVVVSPRNMKDSCVEIASRDKSYLNKSPLDKAFDDILEFLDK